MRKFETKTEERNSTSLGIVWMPPAARSAETVLMLLLYGSISQLVF
jgi:hypothetical protein